MLLYDKIESISVKPLNQAFKNPHLVYGLYLYTDNMSLVKQITLGNFRFDKKAEKENEKEKKKEK